MIRAVDRSQRIRCTKGGEEVVRRIDASQREALDRIRLAYDALEPFEVYYELRDMKVRYLREATVDLARWCLAVQSQGYFITTDLLGVLTGKRRNNIRNTLNRLGANQVLTLVRRRGRALEYVINPLFGKRIDPRELSKRGDAVK